MVVLILVKSKGFFDLSMLIFYDRGCTLFFRGRFFKIKGFFGKGLNLTFYFSPRSLFNQTQPPTFTKIKIAEPFKKLVVTTSTKVLTHPTLTKTL